MNNSGYGLYLARKNEEPKNLADENPFAVEDTLPVKKMSYGAEEHSLMEQPILDFYFFVAHGNNINSNHNFYPIETDFEALTMYSMPYELYRDTLIPLFKQNNSEHVCRLIYGACPKIPIVNKDTGKKIVYLPPLIFSGDDLRNKYLVEHMGLYHFKISKEGYITGSHSVKKPVCKVMKSRKIVTNDILLVYNKLTYSNIFNWIEKDCKRNNIDPNSVMLGIMSCQSYQGKNNNTNITSLIPKQINTMISSFINTLTDIQSDKYISLQIDWTTQSFNPIQLNKKTEYYRDHGASQCGWWNVFLLSAGFVNTEREDQVSEIICSRKKEFSIFELIKYVYPYSLSNEQMVIRFPIINGLNIIFNYINNFEIPDSSPEDATYTILFCPVFKSRNGGFGSDKICLLIRGRTQLYYICYSDYTKKYYEYSEILKLGNDKVDENINKLMTLTDSKSEDYELSGYDYIDIVFIVKDIKYFTGRGINKPNYNKEQFKNLLEDNNGIIINKETYNDIASNKGGKKIKRKNKKSNKKIRSKKNYTRKRIMKNKKQLGGNNDPDTFEKLMLTIDRENDVETKLILNNI
jgi:hypothetical protein